MRNTAKKPTPKQKADSPKFPYQTFLDNYHRLDITAQQAQMILQIVRYWKVKDRDPFPSNATLARKMDVSVRTVRRWKSDLVKKGLIRLRHRIEYRRQTSSCVDFGPLVEALYRVSKADMAVRAPRTQMSGAPRTQVSYLEEHRSTYVDPCSEKEGCLIVMNTLSGAEGSQTSDQVTHDSRGSAPPQIVSIDNPVASPTTSPFLEHSEDSPVAKKDLQAKLDAMKNKASEDIEKRKAKRKHNRAKKYERELAVAESISEEEIVQLRELRRVWRECLYEFWPHVTQPLRRSEEAYMIENGHFRLLLGDWGFEESLRIIRFAVEHWESILSWMDRPPATPSIVFLRKRVDWFREPLHVEEEYKAAKAALDKWQEGLPAHDYSWPPDEIDKPYQAALEKMKKYKLLRD